MKNLLQKPVVLLAVLVLAVLLAVALVKSKAPAEHQGASLPQRSVEVIEVRKLPFRSRVTGYGNVEPSILLESKAEVAGKLSYLHPKLKRGNTLPADTVVARIDPVDYQVLLRQTEADVAANKQALLQLEEEEKSTRRSLGLVEKNLDYARQELERIEEVYQRKLISRSSYDAEQQKVLQQEQSLEELQGRINAFASRKDSVKAQIRRAEEQVKSQQTNLGRTEIRLPFNARIGEVLVEKGEFVSVGAMLFEALDLGGAEINTQLPLRHLAMLTRQYQTRESVDLSTGGMGEAMEQMGLTARVRAVGLPEAVWQARVLRISESIDPTRRTIGVVVGVDNPYEGVIPGRKPPLVKGMYTAVELFAPAQSALVVPRRAVHQNRVYLADQQDRLQIRDIEIMFRQGELVVVRGGLNEGDRLIVTDLYPVIAGMPLQPLPAPRRAEQLAAMALGDMLP